MFSFRLFYAVVFIVLSPVLASAHGDRPSFEMEVGEYLIDIGYNRVGIRPDEEVIFDFDLYTNSGSIAFASFEEIQVRFLKDDEPVLDETLANSSANIPSLKYTFDEAGDYAMEVSYVQEDGNTVDASFAVPVGSVNGMLARLFNIFHYVLAAFLVATTIVLVIKSRRSTPPS